MKRVLAALITLLLLAAVVGILFVPSNAERIDGHSANEESGRAGAQVEAHSEGLGGSDPGPRSSVSSEGIEFPELLDSEPPLVVEVFLGGIPSNGAEVHYRGVIRRTNDLGRALFDEFVPDAQVVVRLTNGAYVVGVSTSPRLAIHANKNALRGARIRLRGESRQLEGATVRVLLIDQCKFDGDRFFDELFELAQVRVDDRREYSLDGLIYWSNELHDETLYGLVEYADGRTQEGFFKYAFDSASNQFHWTLSLSRTVRGQTVLEFLSPASEGEANRPIVNREVMLRVSDSWRTPWHRFKTDDYGQVAVPCLEFVAMEAALVTSGGAIWNSKLSRPTFDGTSIEFEVPDQQVRGAIRDVVNLPRGVQFEACLVPMGRDSDGSQGNHLSMDLPVGQSSRRWTPVSIDGSFLLPVTSGSTVEVFELLVRALPGRCVVASDIVRLRSDISIAVPSLTLIEISFDVREMPGTTMQFFDESSARVARVPIAQGHASAVLPVGEYEVVMFGPSREKRWASRWKVHGHRMEFDVTRDRRPVSAHIRVGGRDAQFAPEDVEWSSPPLSWGVEGDKVITHAAPGQVCSLALASVRSPVHVRDGDSVALLLVSRPLVAVFPEESDEVEFSVLTQEFEVVALDCGPSQSIRLVSKHGVRSVDAQLVLSKAPARFTLEMPMGDYSIEWVNQAGELRQLNTQAVLASGAGEIVLD